MRSSEKARKRRPNINPACQPLAADAGILANEGPLMSQVDMFLGKKRQDLRLRAPRVEAWPGAVSRCGRHVPIRREHRKS